MNKSRWILLLVCAILTASVFFAVLYRQEEGDYSKMLVIDLHIGPNGVTENFVDLRYGHPPRPGLSSGTFSGRLLSADGQIVNEFAVWDPRMQVGDEIVDDGNGGEVLRGAILHSPEADLHVTLPYTGVEEQFELHDRASGTLMKSVNLSNAITTFSRTYPSDPAGPAIVPSYEGMPFLVIIAGCVIFFFLILVVLMMVRKG